MRLRRNSQLTVSRWLRTREKPDALSGEVISTVPSSPLVPVQIVDTPVVPMAATPLVVTTPRGLRIEGLDLDALCTLIARLG